MADSDKIITVTPNTSVATTHPEIKFVGKDNSPMYLKVLDDNTLSFEGTEGQVFAINPTMSSGDIFSVNDISGIQSMVVNADGTITIDAQTKSPTIKNNASNTSTLILSNNNADAVDGPILEFFRDSASPADNDHMGSLVFTGRDDAGNKQEYGRITMHNDDATAASNGGELVFKLTEANSDEQEYMRLRASSRQIEFNTSADDIDLTYNTDATSDFFYINAGTQRIGIGDAGTAPNHLLHLEGVDGGNGEILVERASGAQIKTQAQSATGVFGTSSNHQLAFITNGSQRVKIDNQGGIEAVSSNNGWNLWHKVTWGKVDYGTANGDGAGLKTLTVDDDSEGLPVYTLPKDATIRAMAIRTNGVVLSGTTAQVWRLFANGDAGSGTLMDVSVNAGNFTRQNSENSNATHHYFVQTGLSTQYNAGDTLGVRRNSGAVDMGTVFVDIWFSFDNA